MKNRAMLIRCSVSIIQRCMVSLILLLMCACGEDIVKPEPSALDMTLEFSRFEPVYPRAERNSSIYFTVSNESYDFGNGETRIVLPETVTCYAPPDASLSFMSWQKGESKTFHFEVEAQSSEPQEIKVEVVLDSALFDTTLTIQWNPAVEVTSEGYAPEPEVVSTGDYLVGAHRCDLWKMPDVWDRYQERFPKRQPVIGWYDEGEPEVTDWEIKYALEHGISFFFHCWYRDQDNLGKSPVLEEFAHVLHSYDDARYGDQMGFALNWINSRCGVSGMDDLMETVMPFLIETYFKKENYLKIDNKPVLMIYGPDAFISDLGGEANALEAITLMRQACVDAGFSGMVLMGQYCWGPSTKANEQFKTMGLEYSSAYHLPTFSQVLSNAIYPSSSDIIQGHSTFWDNQQNYGALPNIITCSMGWHSEPWGFMHSKKQWRLPPDEFQELLQNARDKMDLRPQDRLDSKMVLLDNWNEYGEGHYIFPTREYAFGYLDAIRNVFSDADPVHTDLIPEDVGMDLNILK
jgi:hypothetical protein